MNPDLEAQRERQREDVAAIPSELCETASRRSWNCEPGRDAVTLEAALRALAESLVVEDEVVADTLSDLRRRYRAQLIMSSRPGQKQLTRGRTSSGPGSPSPTG